MREIICQLPGIHFNVYFVFVVLFVCVFIGFNIVSVCKIILESYVEHIFISFSY